MMIHKEKIWVHKNEVVESLVVKDSGKVRFYSYTYLVKEGGRDWVPYVKWDNWDGQPHVDKYDSSGALVEQKLCTDKTQEEALKLVKIFRKKLMAMDIRLTQEGLHSGEVQ